MATEVVMPQMGESIAEGTITKWLVKVGDTVERDQPLFEISTDKVDAEIPSPASGQLLEIRGQEGETISVNEVVALIGEAGEKGAAVAAAAPAPAEVKESAPAPQPAPQRAAQPAAATTAEAQAPSQPAAEEATLRDFASPVVRKIAQEEGVDLSQVEGTGSQGRVTKKDILAYLETQRATAPAARPAAAAAPAALVASQATKPARTSDGFFVPAYTEGEAVEIEAMSKIRQITSAHMRYSKDTAAHVTTVFHIDMSRVAYLRQRAKRAFAAANGTKLTYMPFIIKAVATALRKHRKLNASIDGDSIVYKKNINVGIAVALDWGLLVPVIRNADQLSLLGIARVGNDLADRARSKKLSPDEVQGGTFTITNPGVFGSLFGTPIINQPQVAILGVGAVEKRPVVVTDENGNDSLAIRTMSYLAITYDHRLVDGADADHFMNDVKQMLEEDSWGELDPYL